MEYKPLFKGNHPIAYRGGNKKKEEKITQHLFQYEHGLTKQESNKLTIQLLAFVSVYYLSCLKLLYLFHIF